MKMPAVRILLVGNYERSRQQSMERFAYMLWRTLTAAGHQVRLVRPPVLLGRLYRTEAGLSKWIGYVDRFLFYPLFLRRQAAWADVVHICDQANAVYIPHLRGKPHVVTCHDMLALRAGLGEIPEAPTRWSGRIYQRWILRNLRKAQMVVCVSRQTEREIQRVAGLPSSRLLVVPNAQNYHYKPMESREAILRLRPLGIDPDRPFFLHVGGNDWEKDKVGVVTGFQSLVRPHRYREPHLALARTPGQAAVRSIAE